MASLSRSDNRERRCFKSNSIDAVMLGKSAPFSIMSQFTVSIYAAQGLQELRSLYEHLQARTLEMIETLDELRASSELEIFRSSEADE